MDGGSTRDQTEKQNGVPPPSRAGHDPQVTTPKRVRGILQLPGPPAAGVPRVSRPCSPAAPPPHLYNASALRPLARPGPAEDEDDDGLHEEKEAAALQQQDSGGRAAAVGRPKGGQGVAGPRPGL